MVDSNCDFSTDRLKVRYNPVRTSPDRIIAAVEKLGYRATEPGQDRRALSDRREFIRFGVCAFLTMNVMMLSFALYSGFLIDLTGDNIAKISWPMLVMTAAVLIYGGHGLFRKTFRGLLHLSASMETLIVIGAGSATALSVYNQFSGSLHLYYDTACMLITLVLLGKTLENRAKRRVLADLENFFALMPAKVRICTADHPGGRYMSVDHLAPGDIYRAAADEIVPADGRILSGTGTVDESAITGEPQPVVKSAGNTITSGTRIRSGDFRIRAQQVGRHSILGQMIAVIEKALLTKTHLEGKTDVLLKWFAPAILLLAAATGAAWRLAGLTTSEAVLRAVTVTVISCPCALGIAIPLARVAGVSIAGKLGFLVRDFSAFEQAKAVDTIVFDKTGTVTEGNWNLLSTVTYHHFSEREALAAAAGLEKDSDHFIAAELLEQARALGIEPAAVSDISAAADGLSGRLNGKRVRIGSAAFAEGDFTGDRNDRLRRMPGGHSQPSAVYLSFDGKPAAAFYFGDTIRAGMEGLVEELKHRGFDLAIVSGDGQISTASVARAIGIEHALGARMPGDKVEFVRGLQAEGRRVVMVGDGINDAPALAQADLSIAIHSGGTLAGEAADISFMRGAPDQLPAFLDFTSTVNRKINQNLVFTFLYNVIAIPIAMSGLLSPLIAVSAMLLSSISVTANTLLLVNKSS